jgi:hypothetical protein
MVGSGHTLAIFSALTIYGSRYTTSLVSSLTAGSVVGLGTLWSTHRRGARFAERRLDTSMGL